MKRKILPLVIAGITLGATGSALAGAPTVYGKINMTYNKYKKDMLGTTGPAPYPATQQEDTWKLESNASRIGVKGDYEINDNLKVIYKLEYETYVDGDGNQTFGQRNTYGGLQGNWGTLVAGKNDTPLKESQGKVDQFNDLPLGDIKNIMVGENRETNIIIYSTPIFSGFSFTASAMPGEQSGQNGQNQNGPADASSYALTYTQDNIYLAAAYDNNVQNTDTIRLTGQFGIGPVKLGAILQKAKNNDSMNSSGPLGIGSLSSGIKKFTGPAFSLTYDEQTAFVVSAEWELVSNWYLKGQYGQSDSTVQNSSLDDTKQKLYALGVDYKLSKQAKLFAYYAAVDTTGANAISNDKLTDKTFAVGWEFKF